MPIHALDGLAPDLPPDDAYWLAPDATLIGRVVLGRDVGVWFGAVLRGDNEPIVIGPGTNIQEHAILHTDPGFPLNVGAGCTIGHRAILHGCTVGDDTLIGMAATVLNGARIGRNCLVGAGALVPEGREIPEGTLAIGMPAKPVRALTGEEVDQLRRSARHYVANWRRFASGLAPAGPARPG